MIFGWNYKFLQNNSKYWIAGPDLDTRPSSPLIHVGSQLAGVGAHVVWHELYPQNNVGMNEGCLILITTASFYVNLERVH